MQNQTKMVRTFENLRFSVAFCSCRPDTPFRGKQIATHRKKCDKAPGQEYKMCLKELEILSPPYSNDKLAHFYSQHKDCRGSKVTSPRVREFFASLRSGEYVANHRREMIVTLEDESSDESEVEEEEEREEEEVRQEEERQEEEREEGVMQEEVERQQEEAVAVANINEEMLAPSLGDVDFNWDEVEDWIAKENEARRTQQPTPQQPSPPKSTHELSTPPHQQSTIELSPPQQPQPTTTTTIEPQQSVSNPTPTQQPTRQILIPGHSAQNFALTQLKDSLSREEKMRQELINQIEALKAKVRGYEQRHERLRRRELECEHMQETVARTEKVLSVKMLEVERREKAVKEVDSKIQMEKKEIWQEKEKMESEKEKMKVEMAKMESERTKMEVEREKMKTEKEEMRVESEKIQGEKERMADREENLKSKGRTLKQLFDNIKEEKMKEKMEKEKMEKEKMEKENVARERSLLHIPLKNGLIAGDPKFQNIPSKRVECFSNEEYVCGHIKLSHHGNVKINSWTNYGRGQIITQRHNGSDSEGESSNSGEPPSKKTRQA